MLKGSINELLVLCSYAGITLDQESVPANITKVKLGTPAAYFGAAENDRVLSATVQDNKLNLKIQRGAQKLTLMLPISASALRAATNAGANTKFTLKKLAPAPQLDGSAISAQLKESAEDIDAFNLLCQQNSVNLPAAKTPSPFKDIRALKDYDIVLLVDHSGSMTANILNDPTPGRTKWEWIQNQARTTSFDLSNAFQKGVRLVMFENKYEIHENVLPAQITSIFMSTKAGGGTFMTPPLRVVLANKIKSGRPTIICVITDGIKLGHYPEIRDCIMNAIKATPGKYDLSINFFIINSGQYDTELQTMKTDLLTEGARLDIVNLKNFDEVRSRGLTNILIDCVSTH